MNATTGDTDQNPVNERRIEDSIRALAAVDTRTLEHLNISDHVAAKHSLTNIRDGSVFVPHDVNPDGTGSYSACRPRHMLLFYQP